MAVRLALTRTAPRSLLAGALGKLAAVVLSSIVTARSAPAASVAGKADVSEILNSAASLPPSAMPVTLALRVPALCKRITELAVGDEVPRTPVTVTRPVGKLTPVLGLPEPP